VFSISILIAFIWGVVLFAVRNSILIAILPFVLLIDATLMSIMYIGASMYFEKSESTISTLLVTPIKNSELVLSKIIANTIHNLTSSMLIVFVFYLAGKFDYVSGLAFQMPLLIIGIVVTTASFTVFGLILAYYQKDFTELLVNMFIIGIFLMIPSLLLLFGVIEGTFWENALLANPLHAAEIIIKTGLYAEGTVHTLDYQYYVSLGYMVFGGVVAYRYLALPKFQIYAIKESGV
jgi:fluoroquinolone transport system permease protein